MGLREGFFRPSIFEKFHFFYRKRPIFRLGGHMAPPPMVNRVKEKSFFLLLMAEVFGGIVLQAVTTTQTNLLFT